MLVVAVPGPFEPEPCVTHGRAPANPAASPPFWIVIVVIASWATLAALGISPQAAAIGLGAAAGLGLRVAAHLAERDHGGRDA